MYSIAVVDDSPQDEANLRAFLHRFEKEQNVELPLHWHSSAEDFLENYHHQYDIVFMDIRMDGMDGMKAARRLREVDSTVLLIFLTSLAQYAVQGYEVDALDYILKPLTYPALELKLQRALSRCQKKADELVISYGGEQQRILLSDLCYVEVFDHHLQYRLTNGNIRGYGTLKEVEKSLTGKGFFRLNNQTIVNLRQVARITGSAAVVGDREFEISRMRKKDFLSEFHRWGV